jgi:excisionase family DNA binding protein
MAGSEADLVTSLLQEAAVLDEQRRRLGMMRELAVLAEQGRRLLTIREVAGILRVCTATVYRMCARGELPHVRVSNAIRVQLHGADRGIPER